MLLITALVFLVPEKNVQLVLVSIFGILYVMFYSPTAGPAPFAISAEVFSLVTREIGHSLAVGVNFVCVGIVLLIFPSLSHLMGGYTASLALFVSPSPTFLLQHAWISLETDNIPHRRRSTSWHLCFVFSSCLRRKSGT